MDSGLPDNDIAPGDEHVETVLRMRIETIRTNLEQVMLAKDFVAGRRSDITHLTSLFEQGEGIRGAIRDALRIRLKHALDYATTIRAQNDMQTRNLEAIVDNLEQAIMSVDRIAQQAKSSEKIALTMRTRWSAFAADSFDRHVDDSFRTEASELIRTIDGIDWTDLAQAWKTYRDDVRDQSDALFSEYVDFLGGLALRDTGLGGLLPSPLAQPVDDRDDPDSGESAGADETDAADVADEAEYNRDVCVMADELVRQIYYIGTNDLWHSMAVPGRSLTTTRSISRMIRLGFPDWTVWAVPLAAFQFGLVVVDENGLVEKYPGPATESPSDLRVALADAFATFALGPAYALASILIKLEPTPMSHPGEPLHGQGLEAGHEALSDTERVQTILATLSYMDNESIFADVILHLDEWWAASIRLNGVAPETAPASPERVTAWCTYMHEFLRTHGGKVRFSPERWRVATDWEPLVELASTNATPGGAPEFQTVRDLLSAAWYQRLRSPEQSRSLAIAALSLWRRGSRPTTGSPTGRQV
jgi:hypothetical protein